jgi:hypothetical protein
MTEITRFVALAFDLIDGHLAAVDPIVCASPALAVQTALGQWKFLGHAGAVAFSRTDLWLTIVWVTYLLVFLMTLIKRKEPHIYVANWFFLAFINTIALDRVPR